MENNNYKPHKSAFPYKLLKYLYENGKSSGMDAQEAIGLNKWADSKGKVYYHRASYNFDCTVKQLEKRNLVSKLPFDFYVLTKEGELFVENYTVR